MRPALRIRILMPASNGFPAEWKHFANVPEGAPYPPLFGADAFRLMEVQYPDNSVKYFQGYCPLSRDAAMTAYCTTADIPHPTILAEGWHNG